MKQSVKVVLSWCIAIICICQYPLVLLINQELCIDTSSIAADLTMGVDNVMQQQCLFDNLIRFVQIENLCF